METAGEATPTKPAGEAAPVAPAALTPEQMAEVNARFQRDKDALIRAERSRWDTEQAEKSRQMQLSAEQKAAEATAAATQRASDAEAKAARLERMEQLRTAAERIGYVPTAYLQSALNGLAPDSAFNPADLAAAAHASAVADAARLGVKVEPSKERPTAAATGGATNNNQPDWASWTSQQAADHIADLGRQRKFKEAKEFSSQFKRLKSTVQ